MKQIIKSLLVAACIIFVLFYGAHVVYPEKYDAYVTEYAAEYGVSKNLVYGVIKAESNFNPNAVSDSGAFGLMQIMPDTAKWVCEKENIPFETKNLTTPKENIRMGCAYLSYLLGLYHGNETNAIAAYNAGHARVDEWLKTEEGETLTDIPYPETKKYVGRVKKYKKIYANLYGDAQE